MTHGTRFGNFIVLAHEIPCAEHKERRFDPEEGWVEIWIDSYAIWRVAYESRLPNGRLELRVWNFPGTEKGRRRALATAWRLSQGEEIPPHDTEIWIG